MPHPADEHPDSSPHALILIERHALSRTCILNLLRKELAELDFIEMASVDEGICARGRTIRLVMLSTENKSLTDPSVQRDLTVLRVTFPDAPIVIFSERNDEATIATAIQCGASLLTTSVPIEIAIAGIRLLLTDGVYFLQQRGQAQRGRPNGPTTASVPAKFSNSGQSDCGPSNNARSWPIGDIESYITPREEEILAQILTGTPNKIIATQLRVSEHTVKMHIRNILHKLRARNRTEAAFLWHRHRSGLSSNSPTPERNSHIN